MKKLGQVLLIAVLFMSTFHAGSVFAADKEYSINEIKQMIVDVAREKNIPPEILLSVAFVESKFQQFDENGDPFIGSDGLGYGVMQITDEVDNLEEVKQDVEANIRAGADILNRKWNTKATTLPDVTTNDGTNNRDIIEHWYFALMGYNGRVEHNIPKHSDLKVDNYAYQEKVFYWIEERGFLPLLDTSFLKDFKRGEDYEITDSGVVDFKDEKISFGGDGTYSRMAFLPGEQVYVINKNDAPSLMHGNFYETEGLDQSTKTPYYTEFEIMSNDLIFSSDVTERRNEPLDNHFAYYKVQNGDQVGYMASANLDAKSRMPSGFTEFNTIEGKTPPKTVSANKTFTVSFNDVDIIKETVNRRNVYIVSQDGHGVLSNLHFDENENENKVTVDPEADLKTDQTYSLFIKGVKTEEGKMKTQVKHTFTVK